LQIEVLNWEKYNPRNDVKKSSWFRLEHSLIDSPDFFDFSHSEFKAFIYILSFASRKNSGVVKINFPHADKVCNLKRRDLQSAIEKLVELQIIAVHERTRNVHERTRNVHVTYTNATNETNERTNVYMLKIEKIYKSFYPRKAGKTKGVQKLSKEIKSDNDILLLEKSVKNYAKSVKGYEEQYIKHFSTFAGEWKDYIDVDKPETKEEKQKRILQKIVEEDTKSVD
jgi:hypothetical protein